MKRLMPLLLLFGLSHASGQAFITTWNTAAPGISSSKQITIPTAGSGYSYSIYWEAVDNPSINGIIPGPITGDYTITFTNAGTYRVAITGEFPRIFFNEQGDGFRFPLTSDSHKITDVEQWGNITWTSMAYAFQGCANLQITASDTPVLSQVTDLSYMFKWAFQKPYVPVQIRSWNVSTIKNMSHMFDDSNFNEPLEGWDVSNVIDMSWMFYGADFFNQPIGTWDVSNVLTMDHMFSEAYRFNQPLNSWDVSNVTNMRWMFEQALQFNQPLDSWDVSKVTDMSWMFSSTFDFNQSLETWNVGDVLQMEYMFLEASSFNQQIGKWNITSVRSMDRMLDLSGLDVVNYDQTLIGWAAQNVLPGIPLGAQGLRYCAGEAARAHLISNKSWVISGDIKDTQSLPLSTLSVIQPLCKDSTGTITVVAPNTGNELYSFDNGMSFQSENAISGLQPGVYSVIYKRGEGCISSASTIEIDPPIIPPLPAVTGSSIVCPNITEVGYSASIQDYSYSWLIYGGVLQSQQNNSIKVNWGPSNFNASVKAIGYDQHHCPTDTVTLPVKIQIQLKPEIIQGMDSVCYNFRTSVPYQATYTHGSVYTWFTHGGVISEGQSTSAAKIDWTDVGQYRLWMKEENTTSTDYCEGYSDTLNVTVFKDPAAITMNFVSVDYQDDQKVKIQWDATLLERISDLVIVSRRIAGSDEPWQLVATLQKNVQLLLDEFVATDHHSYEYRVEGFNKCDEGLQTVIHNTILLEGDKEEDEGEIDLFWNDYNGWDSVERYEIWRKLDGDTTYRLMDVTPGSITNYIGKYGADGFVHRLRVKAKKMNENTISWSNEIELDFENPIDMIPNVITPNGDTENEYFVIPKLYLYPENSLKIINRWGETVYTKRHYTNDWDASGLPTGTYYYSLHLAKNKVTLNGWVQVVR